MSGAVALFLGGSGLSVSVSPSFVSNSDSASTVVSVLVTATAANGSGSYSYSWIKKSGDFIIAMDPTAPSTRFMADSMIPEEVRNAVFFCRVTDIASGATKDSEDVLVTLMRDPL